MQSLKPMYKVTMLKHTDPQPTRLPSKLSIENRDRTVFENALACYTAQLFLAVGLLLPCKG